MWDACAIFINYACTFRKIYSLSRLIIYCSFANVSSGISLLPNKKFLANKSLASNSDNES